MLSAQQRHRMTEIKPSSNHDHQLQRFDLKRLLSSVVDKNSTQSKNK